MPNGHDVDYLFRRALPDALDPIVRGALGAAMPRAREDNRYRIAHTGRFTSRIAADLLAFFRNQRLDGALLVAETDVCRALFFRAGRVVGATSDCVFERLGRVLLQGGVVDEPTATRLVEREEARGPAVVAHALPPAVAAWAVERRVWDVAAALFLVHRGHFVIVEGEPDLADLPAVDLSPTDLALEGLRRYDEWRHGSSEARPARREPETRPPDAPAGEPVAVDASAAAADELLERLRALE